MIYKNILGLAQKYMFFTPVYLKNTNNISSYTYGPAGSLFLENIKLEWISSNVIKRDISVFLFMQKNFSRNFDNDIYLTVRDLNNKQLPFGVSKIYNETSNELDTNSTQDTYFNPLNKTSLLSETYINPSDGNHYFMHWQRQRKLWWKKISHSPSRFTLGEIYKTVDGSTNVNILLKFPWGDQIMETISISQLSENSDTDIMAHFGTKSVTPMIIKNKMALETALLGLFCDAFEQKGEKKMATLRIHRKLSPYKCIICTTESNLKEEISMLAFNLTKRLRKSEISTIYLPESYEVTLQSQLCRNDEWGIPYTIILDSASLKTGILNVRDRDTTLNEEVHISELSSYMKGLMSNF